MWLSSSPLQRNDAPVEDRIRTVHLLVTAWERSGGLEGLTMDIADAFVSLGWRVRVVVCFGASTATASAGIELVFLSPRTRLGRSLWYRGLWRSGVAAAIRRDLREGDVIVFGHVNLLPALPLLPAIPRVVRLAWLYGLEVWGAQARRWADSLNRLDAAICISHFTAERAREGGVRIPLVLIPCSVDTQLFVPATDRSLIRRHEVLICGRMSAVEQYKGHDLLLSVLPAVRDLTGSPVSLRVVGTGDDVDRLRSLAVRLDLEESVLFTGRLSINDLIDAYQRCGVFCMPSIVKSQETGFWTGEGFGIVYIEAAACGRPVIASTDGGSPETVEPGVTGLLVDPRHPESVAQAIAEVLNNPARGDLMGAQGREMVVDRFSRSAFRERVRSVLAPYTPAAL